MLKYKSLCSRTTIRVNGKNKFQQAEAGKFDFQDFILMGE